MKIITKEEADAHQAQVVRGGLEGFAGGALFAGTVFPLAYKYTHYYRTLPAPLKAFGAVVVLVPCMTIRAEKRGSDFEKAQWRGVGKDELDAQERRKMEQWSKMSQTDRFTTWAKERKYSLVGGAWALSVAASFASVAGRKDMSLIQKGVQARIIAQTLTVALILGTIMLSYVPEDEKKNHHKEPDHGWAAILDGQQRAAEHEKEEKDEARQQLLSAHEKFRDGADAAKKVVPSK